MLLLISPAKTLDETSKLPKLAFTQPELLDHSKQLAGILQTKNPAYFQSLMSISSKLADLNYTRFQNFKTPFTEKNARPALLTFKGDVYAPLSVSEYSKKDWEYATHHLRMLSGLYGLLKPLDLIQSYRLEMGTALKNPKGKDLYAFWGSLISEKLNIAAKNSGDSVLINLASEEYFKAVDKKAFNGRLINIVFKEQHKGALKIIGFHAKRARGLMVEYTIQNRLAKPESLKKFNSEGYKFASSLSNESVWVFIR